MAKGFSPRERNGIIALSAVTVTLMAGAMIIGRIQEGRKDNVVPYTYEKSHGKKMESQSEARNNTGENLIKTEGDSTKIKRTKVRKKRKGVSSVGKKNKKAPAAEKEIKNYHSPLDDKMKIESSGSD